MEHGRCGGEGGGARAVWRGRACDQRAQLVQRWDVLRERLDSSEAHTEACEVLCEWLWEGDVYSGE